MLSRKQQNKVNTMAENYRQGMYRTTKLDIWVIDGWVCRYRVAMKQVLERQGKR